MKIRFKKRWAGIALAAGLVGCGALIPLWSEISDPYVTFARAYAGHDGNSLYVVKTGLPMQASSVEHYDLDGNLISSIPLQDADGTLLGTTIHPTDNDNFYLLSSSLSVDALAYFSPEDGEIWKGFPANVLAANEQGQFWGTYLNSADELVFGLKIRQYHDDNSVSEQFAIGSITPDGNLDQFHRLDDIDRLVLRNGSRDGYFFAMVTPSQTPTVATGQTSRLITFDNNLEQLSDVGFDGSFSSVSALKNRLIAVYGENNHYDQYAVSPDGTPTPANLFSRYGLIVAGHNSFYEIANAIGSTASQTICNYSYTLQQNWCRDSNIVDAGASVDHAEVNTADDLQISLSSYQEGVLGLNGSITPVPGGFGGSLGLAGKETWKSGHQIFGADGSIKLAAREAVYFDTGPIVDCGEGYGCIHPQHYHDGVCNLNDVVLVPGNRIFSVNRICRSKSSDMNCS